MARLLIPSELRNPFPSNSLNCSFSSSTFSSPSVLRRFLVFFVSSSPAIYLTLLASVFKDLITDSSLIPSFFFYPLSLVLRFSLSLSFFFSHPLSALFSFYHCVLAASSIGTGMRSSPFHGRETRLRRKGGVKGGAQERMSRRWRSSGGDGG